MSQTRTEGGGNGAGHIDKLNMDVSPQIGNAFSGMSAMRPMQGKGSDAALRNCTIGQTRPGAMRALWCAAVSGKNKAPLGGRAGPELQPGYRLQEGLAASAEGGNALSHRPTVNGCNRQLGQRRNRHRSYANIAYLGDINCLGLR